MNLPLLINNSPDDKKYEYLLRDNIKLENELNFYKSIFKTHPGSVLFNLRIKLKDGDKVWIDKIRCDRNELLELERDDEIDEWLQPIKCER